MTATDWLALRDACVHRREPTMQRRSANALNVEIGTPAERCTARPPDDWPVGMVLRWIGSGGDLLVFGCCRRVDCPVLHVQATIPPDQHTAGTGALSDGGGGNGAAAVPRRKEFVMTPPDNRSIKLVVGVDGASARRKPRST